MARGITEDDVHTAADALVSSGERPTVERIRSHLGTGSPNTVVRWLDTWWKALGPRLASNGPRFDLPQLPESVADLAGSFWMKALEHASDAASDALAQDRQSLEASRAVLARDREELEREASDLRNTETAAVRARDLALARSEELERLVRRLEGQVEELQALLEAADSRASSAEERHQELVRRHQEQQERAESERKGAALHVQATEDRASLEIDRARQEARDLKRQLALAAQERAAERASFREQIDVVQQRSAEALQEAAAQRARAEALEEQLAKLRDLPAALEMALQQAAVRRNPARVAKPRGPTAKKTGSRKAKDATGGS